jgi:hypothetical protein
LWELQRKAGEDREPSLLEEATRLMGGPEVVQGLVKAILERPAAPAPAPPMARPVVPLQPRPNPTPAPTPAQAAPQALPEPTRAEWREALEETEEVLEILDEHGENTPDVIQLRQVLEAFKTQGEAEGPLGAWWQAWNAGIRQGVKDMLQAAEAAEAEGGEEPTGEGMDLEGFKAMLAKRLDEGATDAEILAELDAMTTPAQRANWRGLLRWMPLDAAAGMLGEARHRGRLVPLLEAFQAMR